MITINLDHISSNIRTLEPVHFTTERFNLKDIFFDVDYDIYAHLVLRPTSEEDRAFGFTLNMFFDDKDEEMKFHLMYGGESKKDEYYPW